MEKKLYTDRRTLYINDKPVSEYHFGNLRYGEPETYKGLSDEEREEIKKRAIRK